MLLNRFIRSDEVGKCVELIEKMLKVKIIMQSSSCDNCVRVYNIEILNLFDPELQLINTKSIINNKLRNFLGELKKFILVLEYKKLDGYKSMRKIFPSSAKPIDDDFGIDKAF